MVPMVSRPFGTCCVFGGVPNVEIETLGYYRKSLRDKDLPVFCDSGTEQLLMALD